ncbi:MAG: hypothetical protein PHV05_11865 [Candidatus Riflebacteria bacterium]|nr:hypothetical protein [Candidatus Riflebacteria bacterium]
MSRLSLLMGLFLAVTVTATVFLLAVSSNISSDAIIFRITVIFFIFGTLGTLLGSFLEVMLMPTLTKRETEKLERELFFEDAELHIELGDLLDEDRNSKKRYERFGTPTDEQKSVAEQNNAAASDSKVLFNGNSAAVS